MSPEIQEILTNREVIAVDQDPLGKQGHRLKLDGDKDIWMKELEDGSHCVAFLNRGEDTLAMTVTWSEIGLSETQSVTARDLWLHTDLGTYSNHFDTLVNGHSVVMVKFQDKESNGE